MGKAKILYVKTKAGDDVLRAVGTLTSGITTQNTPPPPLEPQNSHFQLPEMKT